MIFRIPRRTTRAFAPRQAFVPNRASATAPLRCPSGSHFAMRPGRSKANKFMTALFATFLMPIGAVAVTPLTTSAYWADRLAPDPNQTKFGATIWSGAGDSLEAGMARQQQLYGQLGIVRIFDSGLPNSWNSITGVVGSTPVIISFRASPQAVLSGRLDDFFRDWFNNAPTDSLTRWSYWHEPEDDAERGTLALKRYRAAWQHLSQLANSAGNDHLRATLILMCWTLDGRSGRDWRSYYGGDDVVDVIAYDCYNAAHRDGLYGDLSQQMQRAVDLSRQIGKPWGLAEVGPVVVNGDTEGRAEWLRRVATFARENNARFVSYFDTRLTTKSDFRLLDEPSQIAWREIIQSSFL